MSKNPSGNKLVEIHVSQALLDNAHEKVLSIFSDWEFTPAQVHSHLEVGLNRGNMVLDVAQDVVPPIAFALSYFGHTLPQGLIQKLRNKPQTPDTLFELLCMGILAHNHKVVYEPRLGDGKVPDFMVELEGGPPIYVECKSHRFADAPYAQTFQTISSEVFDSFTNQPITEACQQERRRLEVHLRARPNSQELDELKKAARTLGLEDFRTECSVTPNIALVSVPQSQPVRASASIMSGRHKVGTEWTRFALEKCHLLTYSWPGLDRQRRRLQRELLKTARLQLRGIPAGSYGMIGIQTVSAKRFLPDLHELIDQNEFNRVPLVWLNPSLSPGTDSRIVYRDGSRNLVDRLFLSPYSGGIDSED
ncbi:MAG: hypothetical protein J0M24_25515 [Verrucomicrobia bacterium]|nr:hypothetical protein [Verrucomicrobiota bacterium]